MIKSTADAPRASEHVLKLLNILPHHPDPKTVLTILFNDVSLIENLPCIPAAKHPQGFLTFKLGTTEDKNESLRFHVWLPYKRDMRDPEGFEIHDHVFGFTSFNLSGVMNNRVYEVRKEEQETGLRLYGVTYDKPNQDTVTAEKDPVSIQLSSETTIKSLEYYDVLPGIFHRSVVAPGQLTMTLLAAKGDPRVPFPRMVGPSDYRDPIGGTRAKPEPEDIDYIAGQLEALRVQLI
jgi:hypothetical protein